MRHIRTRFCIWLLPLLAINMLAHAQTSDQQWSFSSGPQQTQLIELYTSEGCSSCPPAERWLSQFRNHPELWQRYVPVAFHVDYWDYLGWKDPFASTRHSQRQRHYRHNGNSSSVYTPQFMVNGNEWRGYFSRLAKRQLPEVTANTGRLSLNVISLEEAFTVKAEFNPQQALNRPLTLHVALLGADISNAIGRGENAGRTLEHHFVVLEHKQQLVKKTQSDFEFNTELITPKTLPDGSSLGLAAWVSNGEGDIIQATGGWLSTD